MINNTTLRKLNNSYFGADINKIELYVKMFDLASNISDTRVFNSEYEKYRELLKELKPESAIFSANSIEINDIKDEYDFNTESYIRNDTIIIGSANSEKSDVIKSRINKKINFVCIPYVTGLNVKCIYINGYVYRIYLCNETSNCYDVTNILKANVPSYIDEISEYRRVELIGKATIFKNKNEYRKYLGNVICSTMFLIENKVKTNNIDLIFTDIIFENNKDNKLTNLWDRLEFMRVLHINVVHHALIRDVDTTTLGEAISSFTGYFNEVESTSGIIYDYQGLDIRELEDIEYNYNIRFIYNPNIILNKDYISTIKSFTDTNDNGRIYVIANIVAINCSGYTIDSVIIDDICKVDNDELHIGGKIRFKVVDNKAYAI